MLKTKEIMFCLNKMYKSEKLHIWDSTIRYSQELGILADPLMLPPVLSWSLDLGG